MVAMVEIKNLTKTFGAITAVDDITFSVDRGEVLGFLGPNGAGKSTTMKMISGFLAPDAGSVTVCGDDISADPVAVKRRIGYLPEGAPLYADMTPARFLRFVGEIRGMRGTALHERIRDTVAKVNLESVLEQAIDTLSKGFKRRVGIAQAILHDPEVLILDEPTDGLDPNQKHEVRELIRQMAPDKAIVLSTHILEEVDAVCSRAVIIANGRVVADGTPAELEARSLRHNAVVMAVSAANTAVVADSLRRLPAVAEVETMGGGDTVARVLVLPRNGARVIDDVSAAVREHGWTVHELHVERGRLDEVFRAITGAVQTPS